MEKLKKILENYATMKVAKKHGRTRKQQEFRKNLAKALNETEMNETYEEIQQLFCLKRREGQKSIYYHYEKIDFFEKNLQWI